MEIGGYEVRTAVLTSFRLDGGAMFGSVPKTLWEEREPPDEKNRIGLVARTLLIEGKGLKTLVDAGMGDKFGPREAEMFAVQPTVPEMLPFRWDELTDVLLTHLHFDHAGGITKRGEGGEARLRAPGARIHLQRRNWDLARAPGIRERASYLRENVEPLRDARLELLDGGERDALPGIRVHVSNGHTAGMQWVTLGEGDRTVAFPADLVPTSSHIHLPFVMGYDMCVETLLREKEAFLDEAAREGWVIVFAHDRIVPAGRVSRGKDGRFALREKVEL